MTVPRLLPFITVRRPGPPATPPGPAGAQTEPPPGPGQGPAASAPIGPGGNDGKQTAESPNPPVKTRNTSSSSSSRTSSARTSARATNFPSAYVTESTPTHFFSVASATISLSILQTSNISTSESSNATIQPTLPPIATAASRNKPDGRIIAGAVTGALLLLSLVLALVLCWRRRRRNVSDHVPSAESVSREDLVVCNTSIGIIPSFIPRRINFFNRQDSGNPLSVPEKSRSALTDTFSIPAFSFETSSLGQKTSESTHTSRRIDLPRDSYAFPDIHLTNRQREIDSQIQRLHRKLQELEDGNRQAGSGEVPSDEDLLSWKLVGQIHRLAALKNSAWALGLTNEIPDGLQQILSTQT